MTTEKPPNDPTGSFHDPNDGSSKLWHGGRSAIDALIGQTIGRYRIKRVIASGGMGTVFEAVQDSPRRTVALKVMKHGIASRSALRRFEYESQILARLRHSGIAQVYDAGTHDDGSGEEVPYIAMEYIPNAKPITDYAREKKLTTRERLELFAKVCDAVYHGHQKGIIHRDLKPSNILVDSSSQSKVIDFGVARATDSDLAVTTLQTDVGQLIGTLQYMSPEQCEADPHDIDTRSDVYALGVVLYEMLCEQLPYDVSKAAVYEAARMIREEPPTRPSSFNKTLRGDVETIALKALDKDRDRRYRSAAEFGADIERYLNNEPIIGRPPSLMYQMRTFARRNKAVVSGTLATFLVLIAGLIGMALLYAHAETLRVEAQQRAEQIEQVAAFQENLLAGLDLTLMGTRIRSEILDRYQRSFERDAGVETSLTTTVTEFESTLSVVNFTDVALAVFDEDIFEPTLQAIGVEFSAEPLIRARLLDMAASTLAKIGLQERALPAQVEALDIRREFLGNEHPDTLNSMNSMGGLLHDRGKLAKAEWYYREALEGRRRVLGNEHPDTLASINSIGAVLGERGKLEEAEPYLRAALEGRRRVLGDEHVKTLESINNMGWLLEQQDRLDEAEQFWREALETRRRDLGDDDPSTLSSLNNIAALLLRKGNLAEAERYFRMAMDTRRRVFGDQHPATLTSISNMGSMLRDLGQLDEARRLGAEAVRNARTVLHSDHWHLGVYLSEYARTLAIMQDFDEAEQSSLEAQRILKAVLGSDHSRTIVVIEHLADLYDAWHTAEPDAGYDAKAAEWRAKLPARDDEIVEGVAETEPEADAHADADPETGAGETPGTP